MVRLSSVLATSFTLSMEDRRHNDVLQRMRGRKRAAAQPHGAVSQPLHPGRKLTVRSNGNWWLGVIGLIASTVLAAVPAVAQQQKPNFVVLMGDDIGMWNIGAYHRGL